MKQASRGLGHGAATMGDAVMQPWRCGRRVSSRQVDVNKAQDKLLQVGGGAAARRDTGPDSCGQAQRLQAELKRTTGATMMDWVSLCNCSWASRGLCGPCTPIKALQSLAAGRKVRDFGIVLRNVTRPALLFYESEVYKTAASVW